MSQTRKPTAGAIFPTITVPRLGGGEIAPAVMPGWRLVIVYRGRHCPLCTALSWDA